MDDYVNMLPNCEWCGVEDDGTNIVLIKRWQNMNGTLAPICWKCFKEGREHKNQ